MPPKPSNTLTEAELRIMRILWVRGESSVGELQTAMPEGSALAYNSVLTTVRILEQKGYVRHRTSGRAFLYTPTVAERDARRSEVRHVLDRFFGSSHEQLLLSVLGEGQISAEELRRLKDLIAAATPASEFAGNLAAEAEGTLADQATEPSSGRQVPGESRGSAMAKHPGKGGRRDARDA